MQKLPSEIIQYILKIKYWTFLKKYLTKSLKIPEESNDHIKDFPGLCEYKIVTSKDIHIYFFMHEPGPAARLEALIIALLVFYKKNMKTHSVRD